MELTESAHAGNWNILVPAGKENNFVMPLVTASESGREQTEFPYESMERCGVGAFLGRQFWISLEREAIESESLVKKVYMEISNKE